MVGKTRFSLGLLMAIIVFLALDIAILKEIYGSDDEHSLAFFAIVLPMANLLILVLPRCRLSSKGWPFWWGFEAIAWVVIGVIAHGDLLHKDILFGPLHWFDTLHKLPINSDPMVAIDLGFCVFFYTPPQLLIATLGGWVVAFPASRFRWKTTASMMTFKESNMIGKSRWSIGMLMVVVLMAAVDCAVVQWFEMDYTGSDWLGVAIVLVTPMINILIFGLLRMRAKPAKRRFWLAFEAVGWSLTTSLLVLYWYRPHLACLPFELVMDRLGRLGWSSPDMFLLHAQTYLAIVLVYGIPPAVASTIAGWIGDGDRGVIVRRVRLVDQASGDGPSSLAKEGD